MYSTQMRWQWSADCLHRCVSAVVAIEDCVSGFAYMVCVVCRVAVRCAVTGLRDGYLSAGNEERFVASGQTSQW